MHLSAHIPFAFMALFTFSLLFSGCGPRYYSNDAHRSFYSGRYMTQPSDVFWLSHGADWDDRRRTYHRSDRRGRDWGSHDGPGQRDHGWSDQRGPDRQHQNLGNNAEPDRRSHSWKPQRRSDQQNPGWRGNQEPDRQEGGWRVHRRSEQRNQGSTTQNRSEQPRERSSGYHRR